jgi:hypothetical protein
LVDKYHSLIERTRSLGEMVDSSAGPRKCKISLEHLVMPESKGGFKNKNDGTMTKGEKIQPEKASSNQN